MLFQAFLRFSGHLEQIQKLFTQFPIPFEVPFTAHGFTAVDIPFGIQERPRSPTCRFCTFSAIVGFEARIKISGPSHISARATSTSAAEDVNKAAHD